VLSTSIHKLLLEPTHLQRLICHRSARLRRRVLLNNVLDLLLVRDPILLEQVERIGLRGRLRVRLVEQRLDAQQDLLNGNCGFPALFFVKDREADGTRGVDVWVEEWWNEFAFAGVS
jgi:hypothetical protein